MVLREYGHISLILTTTIFLGMKPIIYPVHGRNVEVPVEFAHLVCMKRREDLAKEYEISERDLRSLLRENNVAIPRRHLLMIEDVLEVYLVLGWPLKMHQAICDFGKKTFNL
jgi:hypothetical protein